MAKPRKPKYIWFKYRICNAWGRSEWAYVEVDVSAYCEKEQRQELRDKIDDLNKWRDHYRGCEIVKIKYPPRQEQLARMLNLESNIASYQQRLIRYQKTLPACKAAMRHKRKTGAA